MFKSLLLLLTFVVGIIAAVETRASQVKLLNYDYTNNILSGSITVQNIAYEKVVSVFWAAGNNWQSSPIKAQYASGPDGSDYETWTFSGNAQAATDFYVQYQVSGQSYYDPGNYVNYHIGAASTTTTPVKTTTTTPPSSSSALPTTTPSSSSIKPTTTPVPSSSPTTTRPPPVSVPDSGPVKPSAIPPFYSAAVPSEAPASPPSGCGNYNGKDSCASGSTYTVPDGAENRRWQTPPKGDSAYIDSFQSYRSLTGYADIQYSSARQYAAVVVNCLSRAGESLTYEFNGANQTSNVYQANAKSNSGGLKITVYGSSGSTLVLDPLYFIWEAPTITSHSDGQKGAIVELFGWPYDDIAQECTFLSKAGYMGLKIWPPQEHVFGSFYYEPDGQFRPWYFAYQPVSYRLQSRLGSREQLRSMIQTCRQQGVRVYFDAVINHMTGNGYDIQNHRNGDCSLYSGHNASAGSPYFTWGQTFLINPFTKTRPTLEYPAVPFGPTDFHCERSLSSWTDGQTITKGWLVGLTDLNSEKPYVQDRIATYLVDVMSLGASGFRVDAAKHIGPAMMAQIYARVAQKLGGSFPSDFITWNEVILGGEKDLLACSGGEWSWYTNFNSVLSGAGMSDDDISKIKIWSSDYPKEFPACGSWVIPASRFVIQNDDHDQQNPGSSSRDMADKGSVLVKDKDVAKHRKFEVQLFDRTDADWSIKAVLSSYMFAANGGAGFPDGLSDCKLYTGTQSKNGCLGMEYDKAFVANACGYGGGTLTPGKYTRVHRDVAIVNAMRRWVGLAETTANALGIPGCA